MRNRNSGNRRDWRDDNRRHREDDYQMNQSGRRDHSDYGQGDRDPNYYGSEYQGGGDFDRQSQGYGDYGRGNEQFGSGRRGGEQLGGQRSSWGGRPMERGFGYGGGNWDYGSQSRERSSRQFEDNRRSPDYDEDRYSNSQRDNDYGGARGYGQPDRIGGTEWGGQEADSRRGADRNRYEDDYLHWRNEQVNRFDKDYSDYQTERRKKFSEDFDKWRSSRSSSGETGSQTSNKTK